MIKTQKNLQKAIDNLEIATKGVYQINYDFVLESNDSVGNDWQKYVTYNDSYICAGDYITAPLNSIAVFNVTIIEDDSVPDMGTVSFEISLENNEVSTANMIVKENKGRYYGNIAVWTVYCSVCLIELI